MDSLAVSDGSKQGLLQLTCTGVIDETPTIKTFTFRPAAEFIHQAGQALTLALEVEGQIVHRTFSISSPPGRDTIDLTVKAHGDGGVTRWMHQWITVGTRIQARAPRGHFMLSKRVGDRIAFVSAGSGATPLKAMLEKLATTEPNADVIWVHAARDPSELLFSERFPALQALMPNLQVSLVVSRTGPQWYGYRGRLSRRLMSVIAPDLAQRDVFCCGPSSFMDELRLIYMAEGGNKERFHTETFGRPMVQQVSPAVQADSDQTPTFKMSVSGRNLDIRRNETVLQACLRQGIIIPSGCCQGMCGTCLVNKTRGQVEVHHQGGILPEEEAAGYILACSSKPLSDIAISI